MAKLKAMEPAAAWEAWKARHGQHCWAMHMTPAGCARERTCAFLHADLRAPDTQRDDRELVHG